MHQFVFAVGRDQIHVHLKVITLFPTLRDLLYCYKTVDVVSS